MAKETKSKIVSSTKTKRKSGVQFKKSTATVKKPKKPTATKKPPASKKSPAASSKALAAEQNTGIEEDFMCGICMNTRSRVKTQRILKCGHGFHQFCINRWFTVSSRSLNAICCPVCRQRVVVKMPCW